MKYLFRVLMIFQLGILFSAVVDPNSGWSYVQSVEQAFHVIINSDQVEMVNSFGGQVNANGDGSLGGICSDDPTNCDALGAFKSHSMSSGACNSLGGIYLGSGVCDICVGWVYYNTLEESNGLYNTTLPLMGDDGSGGEYDYYLNDGDVPILKLYDASEGITYELSYSLNLNSNLLMTEFSNNEITVYYDDCGDVDLAECQDEVTNECCASISFLASCQFDTDSNGICDEIDGSAVLGCTDEDACNYDSDSNFDDGSCEYPEENFDCDGNCTAELDCAGVCGGNAVNDECGVCEGPGAVYECGCSDIPEGECDCDGNVFDECGECGGNGPEENYDCDGNCSVDIDCEGVCGGNAVNDECGVCEGPGAVYECGCSDIPEGECDCDGNVFDECGECGGNGPEENYDCDGNCVNIDCAGECGGNAVNDECGVCEGDNSTCTGCMDQEACNYDEDASIDGGCEYPDEGFDCNGNALNNDLTSPDTFEIVSIYPNPFNPSTHVRYSLTSTELIDIRVLNSNGNPIELLFSGYKSAGYHDFSWTPHSNIPSGQYFIQINTPNSSLINKVTLIK